MRKKHLALASMLATFAATSAQLVQAGTVGTAVDTASVSMDVQIGDESFTNVALNWGQVVDEATGRTKFVLWGQPVTLTAANGGSFTIGSASFDPDPFLLFSASATNNGNTPLAFSFSFNTPLSPALTGPVSSHAELTVGLTDGQNNGAAVLPLAGDNFLLKSYDFYANGQSISKNVDLAPGLSSVGSAVQLFSATSSLDCVQACVAMSANLRFVLTAQDSVGFSGKVEQAAVPLPGALMLFGSGLAGLFGVRGRRRKAA